jgi:hypothetical protein
MCSRNLVAGPYPQPDKSSLHPRPIFLYVSFQNYFSSPRPSKYSAPSPSLISTFEQLWWKRQIKCVLIMRFIMSLPLASSYRTKNDNRILQILFTFMSLTTLLQKIEIHFYIVITLNYTLHLTNQPTIHQNNQLGELHFSETWVTFLLSEDLDLLIWYDE